MEDFSSIKKDGGRYCKSRSNSNVEVMIQFAVVFIYNIVVYNISNRYYIFFEKLLYHHPIYLFIQLVFV